MNIPNKFAERFPELNSNWHVSIPTVLEEDFEQRRIATQIEAQSIDNEIAQMVAAVEDYTLGNCQDSCRLMQSNITSHAI